MSQKKIAVVGAGIVGLSTSYYLQSSGHQVTLYDQNNPGSGTSRGHASVIADYGIPALNQPDVWKNLFRYLFYKDSPLAISWTYIPSLLPWATQFLKNCNVTSMNFTAKTMAGLLKDALPTYQSLLSEINANELITHKGTLYVWMKQKEQPSHAQIKVRQLNNVEQINISKHEIHDLEPNLSDKIKGGWYFPKACHTLNPDKILKKLFNKFIEKNGLFIQERVSSVNNEDKKFKINGQNYDDLVICCGAFSKELVKEIEGKTIPLETERGYHVEYLGMQEFLSRPTCLVESGMYLTPLEYGIRAAGTVELAGNTDQINQSRINFINNNARKLIPKLQDYQNTWLGYRPTLPDCLPVISKSSKFDNLYYAFGHNHLGWTLGPITGKIVTRLINKDKFDNQALEMNRFIK